MVAFAFGRFARIAGMFRGLRDLLVSQFGLDAAEKAIPGWTIDDLAASDEEEPTGGLRPAGEAGRELSQEQEVTDPTSSPPKSGSAARRARREFNEKQTASPTVRRRGGGPRTWPSSDAGDARPRAAGEQG